MLLKVLYTLMTICRTHSALWCVHVETSCRCSGKMQWTISMPAKETLEESLEDIQSEAGREIVMKMSSAFSLFGRYSETACKLDSSVHGWPVIQP